MASIRRAIYVIISAMLAFVGDVMLSTKNNLAQVRDKNI
jgi:hypothetical protein